MFNRLYLFVLLSTVTAHASITVSGLSSGAFMAHQVHVAHSSRVTGAAILAGGPFFCAKGTLPNALNRCMKTVMGLPVADESVQEARRQAAANHVDALSNLAFSKVYVLAGTRDQTVLPGVGSVLVESYRALGVPAANLVHVDEMAVGHAFPTQSQGNACPTPSKSPYISRCGRDVAGEFLELLAGPLGPRAVARGENLVKFDQSLGKDAETLQKLSLGQFAYAYVPAACAGQKASCHAHVAFHGCKQTIPDIGDAFMTKTGYNEWAEGNRLIIIYPQVVANPLLGNPNGCWDWWGYSGPNYHTRDGAQLAHVMAVVEAFLRH